MNRRNEAPRAVDQPEPGTFLLKLVKGGPLVAAQIFHVDGLWSASINGALCGEAHADPVHANGVFRVWHYGIRATQEEYDYQLRLTAWAIKHAPHDPAANPTKPIDLASMPPVF